MQEYAYPTESPYAQYSAAKCQKMSKKKKKRLSANICQDNTLERHRHEHCLLALDNVCPQITFPSIFLHSVSGTTIINF